MEAKKRANITALRGYQRLLHPQVHPTARTLFIRVLQELVELGYTPVVVEVYREPQRQRYLYAQGRSGEALRRAGLTAAEIAAARQLGHTADKPRVTGVLSSMHTRGRAMDIAWLVNGKVTYQVPDSWWQTYGAIARKHGLIWGGDWRRLVDRPHVEYRGE